MTKQVGLLRFWLIVIGQTTKKRVMSFQVLPTTAKKLASNPKLKPTYSVEAELNAGQTLQVVDPRATRAMVALMDMQAVLGGAASHWGGPSAFAELMSALHGLMFQEAEEKGQQWYDLFNFVNDAGHCENGIYALRANYGFADLNLRSLKGFRSLQSPLSGHGEAHLFPQGVLISNGPLGSSIAQAQGLAVADRLLHNDRITITAMSDGGCMEGEAREALASIPGLAMAGRMAPFILIISDNNTKLSGRIDKDAFSMEPTFQTLGTLGWEVLTLPNGHDLSACAKTIQVAFDMARANPNRAVAIHARTVKGFGIKKTAESSTGGHGFPLKDASELRGFLTEIYQSEPVPQEFLAWADAMVEETKAKKKTQDSGVKVQSGIAKALIKKREEGLPIFSVSADLQGSTGVADFQKKFPDSFQEVGVAEANMVSVAAGLSKAGFIPVVDTFSQFGVTKGALPMWMGNLSDAPVIAIYSHAGFQDAADGASHQALAYFAMASAIPHTKVFALSCADEAEKLLGDAIEEFAQTRKAGRVPSSYVFFLGRENFPQALGATSYELGKAQVLKDSTAGMKKSVTLVTAGALVPQGLIAADLLKEKGIGSIVINASSINHPDTHTIAKAVRSTQGYMLTFEDHENIGGMGALILQSLANEGVVVKAKTLGVRDEFGQSAYSAIELYTKHGLDAQSIAKAAVELISSAT